MGNKIRGVSRPLADNIGEPRNADRARWGASAIANFASVTGRKVDLRVDPETLLGDLLADLMHWCDGQGASEQFAEPMDFESALEQARSHYSEERV